MLAVVNAGHLETVPLGTVSDVLLERTLRPARHLQSGLPGGGDEELVVVDVADGRPLCEPCQLGADSGVDHRAVSISVGGDQHLGRCEIHGLHLSVACLRSVLSLRTVILYNPRND